MLLDTEFAQAVLSFSARPHTISAHSRTRALANKMRARETSH